MDLRVHAFWHAAIPRQSPSPGTAGDGAQTSRAPVPGLITALHLCLNSTVAAEAPQSQRGRSESVQSVTRSQRA